MFFWTIQIIFFSIICILLIHFFFTYFKNKFTNPIEIKFPFKRYKQIFKTLKKNKNTNTNVMKNNITDTNNSNMKNELVYFLNHL